MSDFVNEFLEGNINVIKKARDKLEAVLDEEGLTSESYKEHLDAYTYTLQELLPYTLGQGLEYKFSGH